MAAYRDVTVAADINEETELKENEVNETEVNQAEPKKVEPMKDDPKGRIWMATIPAKDTTVEEIETKLEKYDAYSGQQEMGENIKEGEETGYLHYQLIIEHKSAVRLSTLKKLFPTAHFERVRMPVAALRYVNKDKTAYPAEDPIRFDKGIFSFEGDGRTISKLSFADLYYMVMAGSSVNELMLEFPEAAWHATKLREAEKVYQLKTLSNSPRDVKVSYLWGVTRAGKTFSVYQKHGYESVYVVNDYHHPFDNYNGEKVIVFDEFRSSITDFGYMLNLIDRPPVQLNARYSNKWAAYEDIYIISNEPLETQYPEIKVNSPQSWAAFRARIHDIKEFKTPYTEPAETPNN